MKLRALTLTITGLLLSSFAFSQAKIITGFLPMIGDNIKSEFVDDKFFIETDLGFAIYNSKGDQLVNGITTSNSLGDKNISLKNSVFLIRNKDLSCSLMNSNGKRVGTGKYNDGLPFITDNTFVKFDEDMFGYINDKGEVINKFDGKRYILITNKSSKAGGFTSNDMFIANTVFLSPADFPPYSAEGLTRVTDFNNKLNGFMNKKLELVIPAKYTAVSRFSEGLATVSNENNLWGYIDTNGKQIIDFTYSNRPRDFHSGLALVINREGMVGYINKLGELLIPAKYERATDFYKGYALVKKDYYTPVQLIDSTGKELVKFPKEIVFIDDSVYEANYSNKNIEVTYDCSETLRQLVDYGKGIFIHGSSYGLVDMEGKVVLDFKYTALKDYANGKMLASLHEFVDNNTKTTNGLIDEQGNWLVIIKAPEF
ncbi:WG repeat-containing protein [Sphingobacterium kyonggiense]